MLYRMVMMCRTRVALGVGGLQGELGSILSCCMKTSVDETLTGALIWDSFMFMEVLEGDGEALERFWDVVRADPRNSDCRRLEYRPIKEREFRTWSVGAQRRSLSTSRFMKRIQTVRPTAEEVRLHIDDVLAAGRLAESPSLVGPDYRLAKDGVG